VCFLPGTLALGATKGITERKAIENGLLSDEDLKNLKLADMWQRHVMKCMPLCLQGLLLKLLISMLR